MSAPEPICKGIFRQNNNGRLFAGYFLKHNADAGETKADDCFITLPLVLAGGEKNCGESGLFPAAEMPQRFTFVKFPENGNPFSAA